MSEAKQVDAKQQRKESEKEGGKKAQDIAGMADMGGVSYFHLACNAPNGNFDDLDAAMNAANKLVDETAEDRKGGAGDYAKIFFSAGDDNLIAVAHVPDALKANIDIKEWIMACMSTVGGAVVGDVYDNKLKAEAKADRDNNLFPLKMRDTAIGAGFEFLRKKGLVNDHDSDDDVDYSALADAAGIEW